MSDQALCVRSMRTGVNSRRIGKLPSAAQRSSSGSNPERLIEGMTNAEHPLITAHRAHRAPYLIGEGLHSEAMVGGREGTGNTIARTFLRLDREEGIDGLAKTPVKELFVSLERNQSAAPLISNTGGEPFREMEAMDGVEEKERPDALIEISAFAAEEIESSAFGEQLGEAGGARPLSQGKIADRWIARGDEVARLRAAGARRHLESAWVSCRVARRSSRPLKTSLRS